MQNHNHHIIDSHAHLNWDVFQPEMGELLERAAAHNVKQFIHPCVELRDYAAMRSLRDSYPQIFICLGVHPYHVETWGSESAELIRQHRDEIVGIGETGLDYSREAPSISLQQRVFSEHCELSTELELPLIIHCRDAFDDTIRILKQYKINRGVMHCYTGSLEHAREVLELGLYISFSGCLTFKNADKLRTVAAKIPLDRMLVETDCPFLAPQSRRGTRNEPAFIVETASLLGSLHGVSLDEITAVTTQNTIKLFSI